MSFASLSFIFYFIPGFFALYYVFGGRARMAVLLLGSLLFYAWGDVRALALLLGLSLFTWLMGLGAAKSKALMWAGIAVNIGTLCFFKYFENPLGLPAGMSFYVFHAVSYLADVRKRGRGTGPLCFAVYMTMFPKLLMGPIVSFDDFEEKYALMKPDADKTADGAFLFTVGLAKKALLAGPLSAFCSGLWQDASSSPLSAWLALTAFGLQLYYDFNGYSDMARGLGLMCGIDLGLNFDHPYASASVSEFWRRWHMSLGAWFRKYLYFPLGGSRKGMARTLLNLMAVWLATGVWHGNTLNYLFWGLGLGVIICFEKLTRFSERVPKLLGNLWQIFWIMLGWVFFNTADISEALEYFRCLFTGMPLYVSASLSSAFHDSWGLLIISAFCASPLVYDCARELWGEGRGVFRIVLRNIIMVTLLVLSVIMLVNSGYSAFIYARF
ncbi:MAG: MBOAT family protein [Firmicutes bacterium]|nr:MBOAT family protein [Bacillota bacterium]